MAENPQANLQSWLQSSRLLVIGLVAVIVVLGFALVIMTISKSTAPTGVPKRVNALARSTDKCVICHKRSTPGIVQQYGHSTMAAANISCRDCHVVKASYPGAVEHEGTHVINQPTTAICAKCHQAQVAQFNQSRHGLP
ncbi:MAG: hypothetical protein O6837_00600, partial [Deltaproteobacteria bacterium]|nr:hypothetical protein [Deltaproteobacteria bacterium]